MTLELQAVHDFMIRLRRDFGIDTVLVGGAARDTYLGREPKDYDLVIVAHPTGDPGLQDLLGAAAGLPFEVMGQGTGEAYLSDADDRGLIAVFEGRVQVAAASRVVVQVLLFTDGVTTEYAKDPQNIVDDHDCDLNKAWFEEFGGALHVRVSSEFPQPGGTNFINHSKADSHRAAYIREKFPEFNHV